MSYEPAAVSRVKELREQGKSLTEIVKETGICKSTVFHWINTVPLPREKVDDIQRSARIRNARNIHQRARARREVAYEQGKEEAEELLSRNLLIRDFVVIYIAEGGKTQRGCLDVTNTDPSVIVLANKVISAYTRNKMSYVVLCDSSERSSLIKFWAGILGVPERDIHAVRKRGHRSVRRSPHGVFKVRSCDVLFFERLRAWIDYAKRTWMLP